MDRGVQQVARRLVMMRKQTRGLVEPAPLELFDRPSDSAVQGSAAGPQLHRIRDFLDQRVPEREAASCDGDLLMDEPRVAKTGEQRFDLWFGDCNDRLHHDQREILADNRAHLKQRLVALR